MLWVISLAVFFTINTALSAQTREADLQEKEPFSNCTGYFMNHDEYQLDVDRIPGVWYQVFSHPEFRYCLDFDTLTDENRLKIAADIKPYSDITDLSNYSMIVKRRCPGIKTNDTEFHLLAQRGDKGVYDVFCVPHDRRLIGNVMPLTVKIKLVGADNETYMLIEDSNGNCLLMTQKPNKYYAEDKVIALLTNSI